MKRETLLLIGLMLALACAVAILVKGSSYTLGVPVGTPAGGADDYRVELEQDREIVRLTGRRLDGDTLFLTFRSVARGKAFVDVCAPDGESIGMEVLYVHPFGVLSVNTYFGASSGSGIIPAAVSLYLALILWYVIRRYREGMRWSLYQYRNVRNLGWIVYTASLLLGQLPHVLANDSLDGVVRTTLNAASLLSFVALPVAFVTSVLVTVSNFRLMRAEGRNWRNMLGMLLGVLVCLGTFLPHALGEFLQRTTIVDVHNERGAALYIEMIAENTVLVTVTYLECILLSTIILSVKAAKRIPAFDKDYILIHGCQIRKDGTPTPLLQGRADRALEFARMQKEASGKDIVFVPSGGKGADEVISEAESIRNYLLGKGVPADKILMEDSSSNTEENMRNSAALVREASGQAEPKTAFATTNYHVFRSGVLAERYGLHAEGIGSKTRSYFWVNAFVREFIATVCSERRKHLLVIAAMLAVTLAMIGMVYLSNTM